MIDPEPILKARLRVVGLYTSHTARDAADFLRQMLLSESPF